MSDLKSALAGAFLGGLLSLGGVWLQSYAAQKKDALAEKRQKIEIIVENVLKINQCQLQLWTITG